MVGGAFEKVLNESGLPTNATNEATKGSRENIIRLQKGEIDFGMSNAAITYFAVTGEQKCKKLIRARNCFSEGDIALLMSNLMQHSDQGREAIAAKAKLPRPSNSCSGFCLLHPAECH